MSHLSAFCQTLQQKGYDAAIICGSYNQFYLSGFHFDDGLILVTSHQSYLITDFRYVEAAKSQASKELEVVTPSQNMLVFIREVLGDLGISKVLMEEAVLSYEEYQKYCSTLTGISVESGASRILELQRRVKDEEELAAMARAQAVTDAAFTHILEFIQPQMTEMDVALELEFFMRKNGAEALAFDTIAVSGTNSSRPHGVPRRVRLEKGFLTMDFGAKVDGYCSDMTRTVSLGKADAEMKKLYYTVLNAQMSAFEQAKEGANCKGLDKIARDIIDSNPEYKGAFGHSLGHGVGVFVHENPRLSFLAPDDLVLHRGNVVTFEPGIYLEGKYGCRIEDMVAIRPDGTVYDFTKSPKQELIELF